MPSVLCNLCYLIYVCFTKKYIFLSATRIQAPGGQGHVCFAQCVSTANTAQNIVGPHVGMACVYILLRNEKLYRSNCFQRTKAYSCCHFWSFPIVQP